MTRVSGSEEGTVASWWGMGAKIGAGAVTEVGGKVEATEYDTGSLSEGNFWGATGGFRKVAERVGRLAGYWVIGGRGRGAGRKVPADVTISLGCGGGGGSANWGRR